MLPVVTHVSWWARHSLARTCGFWRRLQSLITQLLVVPSPPHSLVYYFALLADLCSDEKIQPSVRARAWAK